MSGAIFAISLTVVIAVIALILIVKNMLYICSANEVMIFTGGQHHYSDGKMRGYRLIKGGRALRVPLMERVDHISLSNISLDVRVSNAYCKGGIPLDVVGIANVKISSQEPWVHNAVERFMGKSRDEIRRIAQDTLEGNLRGVLSTLTPEQVNEDKISFAQSLMTEAEQDLSRLGLQLDNLKIQNVSDEKGYLNSIGRIRSAELQKRALIAEAESKSDAAIKTVQSKRGIALAEVDKDMRVARANAERRVRVAETNQTAMVGEVRSSIGAALARVTADIKVQEARIEQVRKQLEADVIQPAHSEMQASVQHAKGAAAKIVADGSATAGAMREVTDIWKKSGDNARDVFLMQKLDSVMKTLVTTIRDINIEKLTVVDAGNGNGAMGGGNLPVRLVKLNEELKAAMGVDLSDVANKVTGGARGQASSGSNGLPDVSDSAHQLGSD